MPDTEPFWTSGAQGTLTIKHCTGCARLLHPSAVVCPECFVEVVNWVPVSGRGHVVALTINYQPWLPALPPPYVVAIVALEDDPRIRLTSNIVGIDNVESVAVVAWFTGRNPNLGGVLRKIAVNPLIIATAAAIVVRFLPFGIPVPLMDMLNLVARAALGMGLMAIGAGLRPQDALRPSLAVWVATALKLVIYPALVIGVALLLGLTGPQISYLALCAAVPTAMNGYVLARQMGGDAELYAAIATVQTAVAFLTIPLVLAVAGQLSAG